MPRKAKVPPPITEPELEPAAIAAVHRVTKRQVLRWVESGLIPASRRIPGRGGHAEHRIPVSAYQAFLRATGPEGGPQS